MTDAEPPPTVGVEEALPTTPDIALDGDGEGYKFAEAIEGEKDGGAPYGEGGKVEEGSKSCGDDVVADELLGIEEDPNLTDVDETDEQEEDAGAEVQTSDVAAAVDVLAEVGAAVASSTLVDAPTEVGMQTNEVTAVDDLTEVGAALVSSTSMDDPTEVSTSLVNEDCNIVSTGGVHRLDDQTDKEVDGDSLDADEAAPLDHMRPQMDVAAALLNEVETEIVKAGDPVAEAITNMDMQVQTGDDSEAEGVGTIADAATTDEESKHMGAVTTTTDDSKKHNGTVGDDASNEGIQMDRDGLTGDDSELKEIATADEDHVEEEGMQMGAINITGDMDKEGRIVVENIADEAVDGVAVPEEKAVQTDEAGDDIPEEEDVQMGGVGLTGNDNEQEEAVTADHGVEEDAMLMDAVANDDDEDNEIVGEDVAEEAVTGTVGAALKLIILRVLIGMMISSSQRVGGIVDVDFDDKSSWWYLFKDYWLNLKTNLSLTVEEISAAKYQKSGELPDTNDEEANSESSLGRHLENNTPKKRGRKRSKEAAIEDGSERKESTGKSTKQGLSSIPDAQTSSGKKVRKLSKRSLSRQHSSKESESVGTSTSSAEEASWASEELLNFVAHMRNGDKSVISQFDVQPLLLDYIKRNNLRDPRRKSQIICDSLLQSLFGKKRVGHFEMLKLLESHFPMSEVSPSADENHGGVVDPDPSQDADGNSEASVVMSSEKRRKSRKYDQRRQPNLDDYAAIDNHNIGLMYLRRNLMEELIGDVDTFDEKVVGSFVRIRIPGTGQRQDIYRLVQIVGTGRAAEKYKSGKKTTDITLEILNLDKREAVTIDIISNQEFTEEECKRLRQSIKYGFIPRLTVGEVQEKARVLQTLKVNDWIESEKMRLGHLRDRASDMGHRKELRECVEKLKLLSTPEERARRLNEEPEIHADPAMDPDYESPEEQEQETERSSFNKSRGSFLRKDGNLVSPVKGDGRNPLQRDSKTNWESNRNTWAESSPHMESPLSRRSTFSSPGDSAGYTSKSESPNIGAQTVKLEGTTHSASQGPSGVSSGILAANVGSGAKTASQSAINESEKIWQYMDPSNKIQGPFSIVQLRKWNSNGYFPPSLKIWKASEKQDDSILLTDALAGKFEKDLPPWEPPHVSASQIDKTPLLEESTIAGEQTPKSVVPKSFSSSDQRPDYSSTNLGASMMHSGAQGYYGVQNSHAGYTNQQSLTGSWNAASNQFGVAVNPMTPTQPAMGSFSGQNIVAAGNMVHLTPGMTPATANAELTSDLPSQNQVPSALPQMDDRLADGENSSHGRVCSSAEGTRNQMSTPSAASVQPSVTAIAGSDTQSGGWTVPAQAANTSGQSQVAGNMTWGPAPQGDGSMGWGMMGQSNMNMPWVASAQGASGYNMGVTMPTQPNAVPNMGWLPNPGNASMNMIWAATQGQGTTNAAAMMGGQMQGVAMAQWGGVAAGNANPYPGWGTQQVGNMNQNVNWSAPVQGNPGQANNSMNWNAPNGNPDWNNQQRDSGGRQSGNRDSGGRPWKRAGGDGGSWGNKAPGVCWSFVDRGKCWKGDCRFVHPTNTDGYSSRNDRHFDRQHSGNERRHDNHNEGNDRQFDRQPSDNERHHDRPDGRHDGRDDDRHDDRQADRSQSREPH
uniref:C3H1-type domain-containing protein n=1 Tax=Setaria italica TaxID=4555 RepID=K3XDQ8_SETIT